MTCKTCNDSVDLRSEIFSDVVCPNCKGTRFHTQYVNGERAAWICDKCRAIIPRHIKSKKKNEVK